jgi:hypothetical protein
LIKHAIFQSKHIIAATTITSASSRKIAGIENETDGIEVISVCWFFRAKCERARFHSFRMHNVRLPYYFTRLVFFSVSVLLHCSFSVPNDRVMCVHCAK